MARAVACLCLLAAPAAAETPRTSYPGAPDGTVAPFVGDWAVFRPGGEDRTMVTCASPYTLTDGGEGRLLYPTFAGGTGTFTLETRDGYTLLVHAGPDSAAAVWIGPDRFHIHPLTASGAPDWAEVFVYQRCPDLPRRSYSGAPDGTVAPFVGEWSAFRPGGEDRTLVICAAPYILSDAGDGRLQHETFAGATSHYTLEARDGYTLLLHDGPESGAAIWLHADSFHLHPLSAGGEPDWENIFVFHRCPDLPRQSYPGAPDGAASAFAGDWALFLPSGTGNRPDEAIVTCDAPIGISVSSTSEILHTDPGAAPVTFRVVADDGHTDWFAPGARHPWEVVWVDPNRFHAHTIGIDGTTDWRVPMIYRRCGG